jgi:hypothetical protein
VKLICVKELQNLFVSFQISSFAEYTELVMKVHCVDVCLGMDMVCAVMSCT